jgi:hypothetical protein
MEDNFGRCSYFYFSLNNPGELAAGLYSCIAPSVVALVSYHGVDA